jgi:hypothetical protein
VSSATGTGTSLAATLDSTTTQDRSLLTFFAAYRDDDADGLESWTESMVTSRYVEHNDADVNAFDSALWLGTENVVSAAAHSRTWSTSAAAEEVYGVMLAWNVADSKVLPGASLITMSPQAPTISAGEASVGVPSATIMFDVRQAFIDAAKALKTAGVSLGEGVSFPEGVTDIRMTVGQSGVNDEAEGQG